MKRSIANWYLTTLPLLQGCYVMDHDNFVGDDGIAKICGVLGAIAFIAGIVGGRATAIFVGALLIIA